jgi:amidase
VIIGKTTASEIGQWPITESETFGVTRNPWNTAHTPGGSSGGSAAAVAAGIVAGAVGSDGAGSVRIPAAWCHLVGCKPQRGRISTWPDPDPFQGLTAFGPLTRTVADAALALDVLTGCEDGDVHRPPPPQRSFQEAAGSDPGRLRIALSLRPPFTAFPARLDREIRAAVERLGEGLERLGHHVEPADPFYGPVGVSFLPRSMAGIRDWVQRVPDTSLLDSRTRANAAVGRLLGGPLLRAARAAEGPLRALVGRIFRRYDLILAPTTAAAALPVGAIDGLSGTATDRAIIAACPYAWPWNVLGWPAINVPAGLTSGGLPIGAQLMGPGCSEERLLAVAAQLEAVEDWAERTPPMWTGGPATSTAVGAGSGAAERRL